MNDMNEFCSRIEEHEKRRNSEMRRSRKEPNVRQERRTWLWLAKLTVSGLEGGLPHWMESRYSSKGGKENSLTIFKSSVCNELIRDEKRFRREEDAHRHQHDSHDHHLEEQKIRDSFIPKNKKILRKSPLVLLNWWCVGTLYTPLRAKKESCEEFLFFLLMPIRLD